MTTRTSAPSIALYHFPNTRAERPRWLLEETGTPYTLVPVDLRKGAQKTADYADIHPLGKVPAVEIDGHVIVESLAICLSLADRFPDAALAPRPDAEVERATYYSWMSFAAATLEPSLLEESRKQKCEAREVKYVSLGPALTPFETIRDYLERHLTDRPYILGESFSAADVMNGSIMHAARENGRLDGFPRTQEWLDRLAERPAFQAVFAGTS